MVMLKFQKEFVKKVITGTKRQTIIIKKRIRHIKTGDKLQLYAGVSTKNCRQLKEVVCKEVANITICRSLEVKINDQLLTFKQTVKLIRENGFLHGIDFFLWFEKKYKLPFEGVIIRW